MSLLVHGVPAIRPAFRREYSPGAGHRLAIPRQTFASGATARDPRSVAPESQEQIDREDDRDLPPDLEAGMEDFLAAMRVEAGLSRNTLRAYRGDLERFLRWSARRDTVRWSAMDRDHLVDYLAARRAENAAESTVARNLVAIRSALRYLVVEGALQRDPSARIPAPVLRRYLPHCLAVDEVEALLHAPDGPTWRDLRDRALLEVLYACGARISEAVGLRTDELEPQLRVLRLTGKGRKTRIVPLGGRAREALDQWLSSGRHQVQPDGRRSEVFLTKSGAPLDRVNAWRRVKACALRAGLDAEITPHTLRHSFATHMIEGGANLRAVQEMLGHASIRTTEIYTHLDADHVRSMHTLYHPRA